MINNEVLYEVRNLVNCGMTKQQIEGYLVGLGYNYLDVAVACDIEFNTHSVGKGSIKVLLLLVYLFAIGTILSVLISQHDIIEFIGGLI